MSNNLKLINTNTINSKPIRNYIKVKNTGGPKGDTGATGATGPQGPQGPAGQAATINIGETTTLLPGQTATVTNAGTQQNATLNFGIPQGLRGPTGAQGPKGDTGPQGLKGDKGNDGAAASVTVGITNTGEPGSNASVTNLGTSSNAILSFTIPTGSRGPQGQTGPQGPKGEDGKDGEKGDKGDAGQAATVTVGSTTTTNPGTSATVTNSGTTSAAVLNFGIPRGATGSVKSEVVSELPETGEGDTFYLVNREATTQTATGKIINFTNSENAGDITNAQIDGETSQNGTPTPDAPVAVQTVTGDNVVKICGKNLLNIQDNIKASDDGLTFSYQNGAITASGTASPNSYANVTNVIDTWLQAGTYTLSISSALTHRAYLWVRYSDGTTDTLPIINAGNTSAQATFAKDVIQMRLDFSSMTIGAAINETFSVQLEKGSTATAYEPYQGQSFEVNLGKNLFYAQATSNNGVDLVYNSTTGKISLSGTPSNTWAIFSLPTITIPTGTYTISIQSALSFTIALGVTNAGGTRTTKNITAGNTNYSFTISEGMKLDLSISGLTSGTAMSAEVFFQLEKGSQATSYAAYFTPIELCKIGTYQDYIYKSDSKWYVHKATHKIVLNGTESWSRWSTGQEDTYQTRAFALPTTFYGDNVPIYPQGSAITDLAKSNMTAVRGTAWGDSPSTIAINSTANLGLQYKLEKQYLNYTDSMTSDELVALFKTWLGSHVTSLYYALATPTDTEITNSALITQLDNLASAALYSGVNNIFTVTPNEVPTLELDYVTYDKYNQNKVYIWNDDLQQWQIIVQ